MSTTDEQHDPDDGGTCEEGYFFTWHVPPPREGQRYRVTSDYWVVSSFAPVEGNLVPDSEWAGYQDSRLSSLAERHVTGWEPA